MKLINTIVISIAAAGLVACNPDPEPEDTVNDAPVIEDGFIEYRNAHDDFWSNADIFSQYYVAVSDDEGLDDIVYIAVDPCANCTTIILKDTTASNADVHVDEVKQNGLYYNDNTFWYTVNTPDSRPASMTVTVRDSNDNQVQKVFYAAKPDNTDFTADGFIYGSEFSGDTTDGVPALPIPSVSSAIISGNQLTTEFNTNSDLAKSVIIFLYDVSGDFIGLSELTASQFQNNASSQYVVDLKGDDAYITSGSTPADVHHLNVRTYSATSQSEWFPDVNAHESISANQTVTHN